MCARSSDWDQQDLAKEDDGNLPPLRVLPLGDSITRGSGSPDGNGYRKALHDLLGYDNVDFIGTLRTGNFDDRDHEGHSGERISRIKDASNRPVKARPNLILLHAGTNDMDKPTQPIDTAPDRLSSLIESLVSACPDATILVSEVMFNGHADVQAKIDVFNAAINQLVKEKKSKLKWKKVAIVKMGDLLTANDIAVNDYKHPNAKGYKKMAEAWYDAILEANNNGWLSKLVEPKVKSGVGFGKAGSTKCSATTKTDNWDKRGQVAPALAKTWSFVGIKGYDGDLPQGKWVIWADINGDGQDEYLAVHEDGSVDAAIFGDNGNTVSVVKGFAAGIDGQSGSKVRFADIDGDGYADYIIQFAGGAANVSINTKNVGSDSDSRNFQGSVTIAGGIDGVAGDKIQYADINGDGRADYLVVYNGGAVTAYVNNGKNKFDHFGTVAAGTQDSAGKQSEHVNRVATVLGFAALGLIVAVLAWEAALQRPGFLLCANNSLGFFPFESSQACKQAQDCTEKCPQDVGFKCTTGGRCQCTYPDYGRGTGTDCTSDSDCRGDCLTGEIYQCKIATSQYADYLVVSPGASPQLGIWAATGVFDKANAMRFADLDGDGRDDYIVVNAHGGVDAWLNKGANNLVPIANLVPDQDDITPDKVTFADVNGDGKADYLVIWEGGSVDAYINTGNLISNNKDGSKRNWKEKITIAPGISGVSGDKIRFADINGDGKADLCVLYDGGAVEGYINTGVLNRDPSKPSWRRLPDMFAGGVNGVPGAKVRLADIDGDNLADYLVLYDGGAVKAFHNTGNLADDPHEANFEDWGTIADGVAGVTGDQVRFADLTEYSHAEPTQRTTTSQPDKGDAQYQ
ncbi:hypothetical protein G7Z17_g1584 [Cylindrodendrum hubeiense]|uniref:SGNH hydrolase-type esterase domain-containing protein n=1 Tax=Cylindrodendrum hubeiense TaxID=595255 RepID=A0A9P5HL98_9HYPO|nr:hypothetical protein G7Z17_g1584 [Cylindrodendrum hubeiense]